MSKPREFWIAIIPKDEFNNRVEIIDESNNSVHVCRPDEDCYCSSCVPRTCVVEKSAYDKAIEALGIMIEQSGIQENWQDQSKISKAKNIYQDSKKD